MNKSSLSGSVAWYGLGNIFIRALSFILLPLYSNLISTIDFGNYSLLMSVYAIALAVYQFGMYSALNKYFIEEPSEIKRKLIFSSILNSILLIGMFLTAVMLFTSSSLSVIIFGTPAFGFLLILISVTILFDTLSFYIIFLLKTMELAKQAVIYSAVGAVLNLILNIILVYFLKLAVPGIIFAQLSSSIVLLLLLFRLMKENYVFRIDKEILLTVIKFSFPLVIANLLTAGNNVADRFLLNIFMGRESVGLYSFAYRIAIVLNIFIISFSTAWNPHSLNIYHSEDYKFTRSEVFGKTLNKLVAVSCILLLVVSLFARYLFDLSFFGHSFFNPVYKTGIIIIPVVMIGYIFNGVSAFYSLYPSVSGKSYHILISDLIAFSLNLMLNIILIPRIGLIGAAIATLFGYLLGSSYLFFVSRKAILIEYKTKEILIIVLSALILLLFGLYVENIFIDILLIILYLFTLHFFSKIKINHLFRFN